MNYSINHQQTHHLNHRETNEIIFTNKCELEYYIKYMNVNKSPGPDAITVEIIKNSLKVFEPLLTKFFNSLLKIGYFPNV